MNDDGLLRTRILFIMIRAFARYTLAWTNDCYKTTEDIINALWVTPNELPLSDEVLESLFTVNDKAGHRAQFRVRFQGDEFQVSLVHQGALIGAPMRNPRYFEVQFNELLFRLFNDSFI